MYEPDPNPLKRLFTPAKRAWDAVRGNPVSDFILGMTPAGMAADAQDFVSAARSRDMLGMGLAAAGSIPIAGDALKGGGKALRTALESADDLPVSQLNRRNWEGRVGESSHLTAEETGFVPPEYLASFGGARGEIRGQHRKRQGEDWENFKKDIAERGIQEPIFVVNEPGFGPRIYEGNHRLDAALELGLREVPVEMRYFGKQENSGYLEDLFRSQNRQRFR